MIRSTQRFALVSIGYNTEMRLARPKMANFLQEQENGKKKLFQTREINNFVQFYMQKRPKPVKTKAEDPIPNKYEFRPIIASGGICISSTIDESDA